LDVTIANNDKLQFYLEEIYDSNHFDKQEMLTWEQQPQNTKTNVDLVKAYFKAIIKATDTYKQNIGRGDAKHNKYKSANQMADYGDEIRKYIQNLASASAAATNSAANVQTKDKLSAMEDKIKKLHAIIKKMATKINNKENQHTNGGGGNGRQDGGKFGDARRPQMTKLRNMGRYCHSHGFHPVGADHDSTTCRWKKADHKCKTTWLNRMGGDMFWPSVKCVAIEQHNATSWKGKTTPSN
jgi:hypothetical protein